MRVLLIEDDVSLALAIEYRLQKEEITVVRRADGSSGLAAYEEEEPFDLILLDRMLPGVTGIFIVNSIRRKGDAIPVLMITAMDSVDDRVDGLNAGADDYLVKPFAMDEMSARVRALTRRASGWSTPEIKIGDLTMDVQQRLMICDGKKAMLTRHEAEIMELLMKNKGKVLLRTVLLTQIWTDRIVEESNLDLMIHYLRKHLVEIGSRACIRTVRGLGYKFNVSKEREDQK